VFKFPDGFDQSITRVVHTAWDNQILDAATILLRDSKTWIPVYILLFGWLIYTYRKQGVVIILLIVISFALIDFISANLFKPFFARIRPCNDTDFQAFVRHIVPCGAGYSFPSNHAANHTMLSTLLIGLLRPKPVTTILLVFWAFAVMFAQLHVGVHYFTDLLGGSVWGFSVALGVVWLYRKYNLDKRWT
jgi:membrane-associated phospholipid phosphatase